MTVGALKQSHPARLPSVHCSSEPPWQVSMVHRGFKNIQLPGNHISYKGEQSLLSHPLPGTLACSCSLSGIQLYTDYLRFLHIARHCNLGCIRPRYMLLDTDSLDSEVVDTTRTRLHTLSIHCLGNWDKSPHSGSAFLVADVGLSKSSSNYHLWEQVYLRVV